MSLSKIHFPGFAQLEVFETLLFTGQRIWGIINE